MRVLVDTNLIARLAQPAHHQHQPALKAVETVLARNDDPCIVPQVVYEFWAVATRPAADRGLAMSVPETQGEIARVRKIFTFLRDDGAIFDEWERLVILYNVLGKNAHDARLVAAMLRHHITHLLTFNAQDFARYRDISVLSPDTLVENPRGER